MHLDTIAPQSMGFRQRLYTFQTRLCRRLVPGLRNAQYQFFDTLAGYLTAETRWLDLGCGHQLVPDWMVGAAAHQHAAVRKVKQIVGIDLDHHALRKNHVLRHRLHADISHLPFADASFNLVSANMVVEHLPSPDQALREIHRILTPDGRFIFHTPNGLYPTTAVAYYVPQPIKNRIIHWLENRPDDDVFPVWYRMNTIRAIRHHASAAGLHVRRLDMVASMPDTLMLGPAVLPEIALIHLSKTTGFRNLRSNIIAVLEKQ